MAPQISQLARLVEQNTIKVDEYLKSNNLPAPSFDPDGPLNLAIGSAEIEQARHDAINASLELLDLLQGPISCCLPKVSLTGLTRGRSRGADLDPISTTARLSKPYTGTTFLGRCHFQVISPSQNWPIVAMSMCKILVGSFDSPSYSTGFFESHGKATSLIQLALAH